METVSVSALRESPRAPGKYVVTLSNGRSLVVGVGALADSGATRIGAVLDQRALARLEREAAVTDLVARAVSMLARSRRTRRELELRLRRFQADQSLVSDALDRLQASGILSDHDIARAEAAARLRGGQAPNRVQQTLRSKGISGRDAATAVADAIEADGFDEVAACRALAEKRIRALSTLAPAVARRRLVGFLQRRGFSGSTIRTVLGDQLEIPADP